MPENEFQASTCLTRRGGWEKQSELKGRLMVKERKVSGVAISSP
jgi:hypothetical protein